MDRDGSRVMKHVLAATILHEANSFARTPAPISHFERQGVFHGEAVQTRFSQTRTEMAGFLAAARTHGWRITTPIAVPCAPAGPMSLEAFTLFRDTLLDGVRAAGELDGVLLALHGANVVDGEPDPDGAIATAVRTLVGPDLPICLSLDPHSNVSDRLARAVNSITAYRTHPHTDHMETGLRAAEVLRRAMAGEIDPQVHLARGWQMRGFDSCRTTPPDGPMRQALAIARRMEREPGVIEVSIQSGFVLADVWHVGPSVAVTANGAEPRFAALARELMNFGWQQRNNDTVPMISVAEALAQARAVPQGDLPIVISDFGDAPGGGGYGDATNLLRALLADPFPDSVFLSLADAGSVRQAIAAGVGATLRLSLGGHVAPEHGGGPIEDDFTVLSVNDGRFTHEGPYTPGMIGNFGPSVLLLCRGVRIAVTTFQRNIIDLSQARLFGVDPARCGLIAIKCMDAFRAAFTPIARAVIACESGGVSSRVQTSLSWTRVRRPIWPLDPDDQVEAAMNRAMETEP
jgi:microcystin degradation protein MlrC